VQYYSLETAFERASGHAESISDEQVGQLSSDALAPPPASTEPDKEGKTTLAKGEVGLLASIVFALAGAAPGQTVSIVLALLVVTAAYGTILPLVITTIGLLCIAVAFQRLNMWRQNAGATYEWVCRAFSPYVGNLVGWLMLVAFGGFVLIDVITIGPSVLALIGISPGNQWAGAAAIVILGSALTATAVVGLRPSARLQITVALIEYVILTFFIIWAFIEIFLVHKSGTVRPSTDWLSFKGTGAGSFSAAMVIAVASVAGWDAGIYVNEETQRPERNPGLGAVIGVAILGVIFVLMFACFQGIAPLGALQAHSDNAAAFVGQRLGGTAGERVISLAVVLSVLATTQVAIIGTSRLMYSMSRDKVLPSVFGVVSDRFRTPAFATAALGGFMMALGVVDIFATSVGNAIEELVEVSGFLYSLFYAITGLAAAWFYRKFIGRSVKDALLLGLLPLSGAGLLLWVAYEGATGLTSTEKWILAVAGAIAVAMTIVAMTVYKSPIFKIKAEAAKTTEPTVNIGAE
jgi:amino acid transporter